MVEEKESRWPKYAVYTLIVIVVLLLILILFLYLIRSPLIFRSGASTLTTTAPEITGSSSLSIDNSYIFASPLRAKSGGEKIRVTVYILDNRGLGMAGKNVTIQTNDSIQVTSIQPITDSQGKATFDIASGTSTGVYTILASVDGQIIKQNVSITFD
jgi:hypothetical protein